jgi:hypothetical protein
VLRRIAEGVLVVVIAAAGVIGLLLFFEGRDQSTTGGGGQPIAQAGPGTPDPTATSRLLRAGNIELRYARAADRNALVALADEEAGTDTSALRALGGAVVVTHHPQPAPVIALAYQRRLRVTSARDPRLRDFVQAWLGKGAGA